MQWCFYYMWQIKSSLYNIPSSNMFCMLFLTSIHAMDQFTMSKMHSLPTAYFTTTAIIGASAEVQ